MDFSRKTWLGILAVLCFIVAILISIPFHTGLTSFRLIFILGYLLIISFIVVFSMEITYTIMSRECVARWYEFEGSNAFMAVYLGMANMMILPITQIRCLNFYAESYYEHVSHFFVLMALDLAWQSYFEARTANKEKPIHKQIKWIDIPKKGM